MAPVGPVGPVGPAGPVTQATRYSERRQRLRREMTRSRPVLRLTQAKTRVGAGRVPRDQAAGYSLAPHGAVAVTTLTVPLTRLMQIRI